MLGGGPADGSVVDADVVGAVRRRCGCVDDHEGQPPLACGFDQWVVVGEGVQDQPFDGGVADSGPAALPLLGAGRQDGECELVGVGGVRDALRELDGGEVFEGVGEAFAEDDAEGVGAAAAEAAGGGVRASEPELGG